MSLFLLLRLVRATMAFFRINFFASFFFYTILSRWCSEELVVSLIPLIKFSSNELNMAMSTAYSWISNPIMSSLHKSLSATIDQGSGEITSICKQTLGRDGNLLLSLLKLCIYHHSGFAFNNEIQGGRFNMTFIAEVGEVYLAPVISMQPLSLL